MLGRGGLPLLGERGVMGDKRDKYNSPGLFAPSFVLFSLWPMWLNPAQKFRSLRLAGNSKFRRINNSMGKTHCFPDTRTQAHSVNWPISRFQQKEYFFHTVCNNTIAVVEKVKSANDFIKKNNLETLFHPIYILLAHEVPRIHTAQRKSWGELTEYPPCSVIFPQGFTGVCCQRHGTGQNDPAEHLLRP